MYFITTMESLMNDSADSHRLVGYCKNYEDALEAVLKNKNDLSENIYYYAMIQKFNEGLYQEPEFTELFMFDWTMREYFRISCQDWKIPVVMG